MMFQHACLRVPFECLSREFRLRQKLVEKEIASITSEIEVLDVSAYSSGKLVDIQTRLQALQAQLQASKKQEELQLKSLARRAQTLVDDPDFRPDTTSLVAEYLMRCGHMESGRQVLAHASEESQMMVDTAVLEEINRAMQALRAKDISAALAWVKDNGSRLRRLGSTLEFSLRKQEFIELVRSGAKRRAMEHASTYLAPSAMSLETSKSAASPMGLPSSPMLGAAVFAHASGSAGPSSEASVSRPASSGGPSAAAAGGAGAGAAAGGLSGTAPGTSGRSRGMSALLRFSPKLPPKSPLLSDGGRAGGDSGRSGGGDGGTSSHGNPVQQLQVVMSLLAFDNPMTCGLPDVEALFHESRWKELEQRFLTDALQAVGLGENGALRVLLFSGVIALRQPSCNPLSPDLNPACPTCSGLLSPISTKLPACKRVHSRVMCGISRKPLDDDENIPVVLPNGYVYGLAALRKTASPSGIVQCARTGQKYSLSEARRVYIM